MKGSAFGGTEHRPYLNMERKKKQVGYIQRSYICRVARMHLLLLTQARQFFSAFSAWETLRLWPSRTRNLSIAGAKSCHCCVMNWTTRCDFHVGVRSENTVGTNRDTTKTLGQPSQSTFIVLSTIGLTCPHCTKNARRKLSIRSSADRRCRAVSAHFASSEIGSHSGLRKR